jgi:DNA-binding IclR family transcriptional regulator
MTSTASPGVERALAVLQFIADHEPRRFTASQLSELLRLNRGTCQSLLAALEIHGCVSRSPSGTFGLGQTLRFWSEQVAPEAFAAGRRIGGALQAFAERHSSRIGIAALIGDEIVVTENHAPPQHAGGDPGPPVAAGLRVPWVPPFGVVFAAFAAT